MDDGRYKEILARLYEVQQELLKNIRASVEDADITFIRMREEDYTYILAIQPIYITAHLIVGRSVVTNRIENIQLVDFISGAARIIK